MNDTILMLQRAASKAKLNKMITTVVNDVDTIKGGMADTGSELAKLKDTYKEVISDVGKMKEYWKNAKDEIFNITVSF